MHWNVYMLCIARMQAITSSPHGLDKGKYEDGMRGCRNLEITPC